MDKSLLESVSSHHCELYLHVARFVAVLDRSLHHLKRLHDALVIAGHADDWSTCWLRKKKRRQQDDNKTRRV